MDKYYRTIGAERRCHVLFAQPRGGTIRPKNGDLSSRQTCLIVTNRVFAHFMSCSIQG